MRYTKLIPYLLLGAFAVAVPACSEDDATTDDSKDDQADDAGSGDDTMEDDTGGKGGGGGGDDAPEGGKPPVDVDGGEPDGGPAPVVVDCPAVSKRTEVKVAAEIKADATWSCKNTYVLQAKTFVTGGTLTVGPGTLVQGLPGAALIVTSKARLVTEGTAEFPVVFTSAVDKGSRAPGNWAGVVLLGSAPINVSGIDGLPDGQNRIEGLETNDARGIYGGTSAKHDCGQLKYTRIEWAGEEFSPMNELNVLTLGGCGSDTSLDYVQVHKGLDDGLEIFGGSPKVRHIVASSNSDDSLDWDQGFVGTVQFLVVVQDSADGDNGWEADNRSSNVDAMPRSNPVLYNTTSVGGAKIGWVARVGTWGTVGNAIFTNFAGAAIDVRDAATVAGTEGAKPSLVAMNSIFFENGPGGTLHFPAEVVGMPSDNDTGFDEAGYFGEAAFKNQFDVDPKLPSIDRTAPELVPPASSPAAKGAAKPPAGFDTTATYIGAFEPGGKDWMAGWTDFSEN